MSSSSWLHRIKAASAKSRQVKGSNYVSLSTSDRYTGEPRCRMVVFRGWYSDEGRNQGKEKTETTTTSADGDDGTAETGGGIAVSHVMLKMVTDARSSKVMHENLECELCWWLMRTSEQFRVRGKLKYVGDGKGVDATLAAARMEQWTKMRDEAREQFFWDHPGAAFSGLEESERPDTDVHPTAAVALTTNASKTAAAAGGRTDDDDDASTNRLAMPPSNFLLMLLDPIRIDHLCLKTNVRIVDELLHPSSSDDGMRRWTSYRVNP